MVFKFLCIPVLCTQLAVAFEGLKAVFVGINIRNVINNNKIRISDLPMLKIALNCPN